jgi:hypothetical protein
MGREGERERETERARERERPGCTGYLILEKWGFSSLQESS